MDIGFIGLGNMGQPMARRLIEAGHKLIVYDTRNDAVAPLVALGAQVGVFAADVADRVETVMASLPSLQISEKVATGEGGVIHGKRVKRFIDLSTTGSRVAAEICGALAKKNIVQIDSPVSRRRRRRQEGHAGGDGVRPARPKSTWSRMRSSVFGTVFVIGDKPGMAQTMKLANNFLSATAHGGDLGSGRHGRQSRARSGGDDRRHQCRLRPHTAIGRRNSRRSILPRTFDYGFGTALMLKDVRLCPEEAEELGRSQRGDERRARSVGDDQCRIRRRQRLHRHRQDDREARRRHHGGKKS